MSEQTHRMDSTVYTIAPGEGRMIPHDSSTFWPRLMKGEIIESALVTFSRMEGDFQHWEMHPNGEELFILNSVRIEIDLEAPDGARRTVGLSAGETFLIPCGHWHLARTVEPGDLTVITFGDGTRHRPV